MIKNGVNPYSVCALSLINHKIPLKVKINQLYAMARTGIVPVTFGDVIHINDGKYSILSGDAIMTMIAKALNPSRVIFAVNTEGIYKNMEGEELIHELTRADIRDTGSFKFTRSQTSAD